MSKKKQLKQFEKHLRAMNYSVTCVHALDAEEQGMADAALADTSKHEPSAPTTWEVFARFIDCEGTYNFVFYTAGDDADGFGGLVLASDEMRVALLDLALEIQEQHPSNFGEVGFASYPYNHRRLVVLERGEFVLYVHVVGLRQEGDRIHVNLAAPTFYA